MTKDFHMLRTSLAAFAICGLPAMAGITVKMPSGTAPDKIVVSHARISDILSAAGENDIPVVTDTISASGDTFFFDTDSIGPARYSIIIDERQRPADIYTSPADNLLMQVTALSPLAYTVAGSALMEGMTELDSKIRPIEEQFATLRASGYADESQMMAIIEIYNDTLKDFMAANPDSPAAIYALMSLEGDDFINAYDALSPEARTSVLYPFDERQAERVRQALEKERFQRELAAGDKDAPPFTFKDLAGKEVSLSDFKGKWVVIDFWGSWCVWCIRGIPALKEAYKEYGDKIVVVGVACNDTMQAWRDAFRKYELPWVNLFNPQPRGGELVTAYGIQGFPTKTIVNPEGKLVDITTGEDPSFYGRLAAFVDGKRP